MEIIKKNNLVALLIAGVLTVLGYTSSGQVSQGTISTGEINGSQADEARLNTITTAVPFLLISPDSRHGAMGDAGVATSPDINAMHWNASKLAFIDDKYGFEWAIRLG